MLDREGHEGQDVLLGLLEQPGDFRRSTLELGDSVSQAGPGLSAFGGGEDRADDRSQGVVLVASGVAAKIPEEVDGAALPGRAEDGGQRVLSVPGGCR